MKTNNNNRKDLISLLSIVACLSVTIMTASGCGSGNDSNSAASTLKNSNLASGSSATGTVIPTPTPSPSGSVPVSGLIPLITLPDTQGWGSADTSSSYIVKNLGYSNAANLGIDSNLRVRMNYKPAIQSRSSTGQTLSYTHNYNTIRADISLLINGSVVDTKTLTVSNGQTGPIADFNTAIRTHIYQQSAKNISIRISNVRTSYKLDSNWCYIDGGAYYYGVYYTYNCYVSGGNLYCLDPNQYTRCYNNVNPVAPSLPTSGWAMDVKVETDITSQL